MSFQIIRYSPKYQNAVVDLWNACNLIVPQNDPIEDIQKKLDFQPELFFIGLLNGQLIGSIMVGYEGHRGWINYLAVLPSFQRRGYGRKLVHKAIVEYSENLKSLLIKIAEARRWSLLTSVRGLETHHAELEKDLSLLERCGLISCKVKYTKHNEYHEYSITKNGQALVRQLTNDA